MIIVGQRNWFCSQFCVGSSSCGPSLALSVEVAAIQQVAIRGPDVPVKWRILLQPRESNRRLVDEQLQPWAALAVIQDEEQVGSVRDDQTGPETSSCETPSTAENQ